MSKISIIGIDLAKHVFQLHGSDQFGKTLYSKRLRRKELLAFLAQQPECLVAMEACGGAHHWAREIQKLGHRVAMIHPQYVTPFVRVNKNDTRDAQAITEAASRRNIPSVAVKSIEQQDIQALHRVRERLMKDRTAIGNELRGLLAEYGVIIAKGHKAIRQDLLGVLEDAQNSLSIPGRALMADLRAQWLEREAKIAVYDQQLAQVVRDNKVCKRLQTIPGIGPINASLLYCHAGDPNHFASARHFSASIGLVPRQHASGGKERLLGISKKGNKHVRKQLVHGARAVYRQLCRTESASRLGRWLKRMQGKHPNKIIVALANKLARIAWAVMNKETVYQAA